MWWNITKTNGDPVACQPDDDCVKGAVVKQDNAVNSKNSTLTFLAVSETDNQTKIFCVAKYGDSLKISDTVTLTVLGVGAVKQFHFIESPPTLLWDKPFTSPDVANVEYHLLVNDSVTGESIYLPPTNETYYNVTYAYLQLCSNYTITVIGKAPGYDGVPYSASINLPGGMDTIPCMQNMQYYIIYIICFASLIVLVACM